MTSKCEHVWPLEEGRSRPSNLDQDCARCGAPRPFDPGDLIIIKHPEGHKGSARYFGVDPNGRSLAYIGRALRSRDSGSTVAFADIQAQLLGRAVMEDPWGDSISLDGRVIMRDKRERWLGYMTVREVLFQCLPLPGSLATVLNESDTFPPNQPVPPVALYLGRDAEGKEWGWSPIPGQKEGWGPVEWTRQTHRPSGLSASYIRFGTLEGWELPSTFRGANLPPLIVLRMPWGGWDSFPSEDAVDAELRHHYPGHDRTVHRERPTVFTLVTILRSKHDTTYIIEVAGHDHGRFATVKLEDDQITTWWSNDAGEWLPDKGEPTGLAHQLAAFALRSDGKL